MSEADAELFRQETEQCRQFAEKALKPLDKEALLRLAGEWLHSLKTPSSGAACI
jgi:hypothetical protein